MQIDGVHNTWWWNGFKSGEPDGESWRLLESYHSRLWD
jgi:hypothetical protein